LQEREPCHPIKLQKDLNDWLTLKPLQPDVAGTWKSDFDSCVLCHSVLSGNLVWFLCVKSK